MSPEAQQQAKKLIDQSQKQCKNIVAAGNLDKSRSYVQMAIKAGVAEEENPAEYVETDNVGQPQPEEEENYEMPMLPMAPLNSIPSVPKSEVAECPYTNSTVNQLISMAIKYGPVYRKERFLIIDQKKLIAILLIEHWLIIYPGLKTEIKPIMTIDLTEYTAIEKKDVIFEISSAGKKTHEFIAKNYKDMMQWLIAINHKKTFSSKADSVPQIDQSAIEYETSRTNTPENLTQEADEIYENVEEIRERMQIVRSSVMSTDLDAVPKLPPRKMPSETGPTASEQQRTASYNEYNNLSVVGSEAGGAENTEEDVVYEEAQEEEEVEYDDLVDYPKNHSFKTQPEAVEAEEDEYHEPNFAQMKSDYATREMLAKQALSNDEELPEYDELLELPPEDSKQEEEEEEELYDDLALVAGEHSQQSIQQPAVSTQDPRNSKQLKPKNKPDTTNSFSSELKNKLFRKALGKVNPPSKNEAPAELKHPKEKNKPPSKHSSEEELYDELNTVDEQDLNQCNGKSAKKVETSYSFSSEFKNKIFRKTTINNPKVKLPQEENKPPSHHSSQEELYDELLSVSEHPDQPTIHKPYSEKTAKHIDSPNGFSSLFKKTPSISIQTKTEPPKTKEKPKPPINESSEEEMYDELAVPKEQTEQKGTKKINMNKLFGKSPTKITFSSKTEPPPPKLTLVLEQRKSNHESSEEELYDDLATSKEQADPRKQIQTVPIEKGRKMSDSTSPNHFNVELKHKLLRKSPSKVTARVRTEPPTPKIIAGQESKVEPELTCKMNNESGQPAPTNVLQAEEAEEELYDELAGATVAQARPQLQSQPQLLPQPPAAQLGKTTINSRTFGNSTYKSNAGERSSKPEIRVRPKLTPKPTSKMNVSDRFLTNTNRFDKLESKEGNSKTLNIIQQMEHNFKTNK